MAADTLKTVQAPLPCPLCGGADVYVAWDEYGSGGQGVGPAHVGCSRCALDMTDLKGETLEDAVAAWNRRALIAQMQRDAVQPVAQEPYAWHYYNNGGASVFHRGRSNRLDADMDIAKQYPRVHHVVPLYAAPHPEAQALDSQLQQPDGHSTPSPRRCPYDAHWPSGLLDRVKAAEQRVMDNRAPRSIPADPRDVDLVLAEVRLLLEGKEPPFWVAAPSRRNAAGDRKQDDHAGSPAPSAQAIHYPECWDTAAYPTLESALAEVYAAFRCTNEDTHPAPSAQSSKAALTDEEIERLLFDIRAAMLRYGIAYKSGDEDGIREFTTAACDLLDQLAERARITRKPLTEEQIVSACKASGPSALLRQIARAIEAAHGITPQAGKESGDA